MFPAHRTSLFKRHNTAVIRRLRSKCLRHLRSPECRSIVYPCTLTVNAYCTTGPLQRMLVFVSVMHCVFIYGIDLCNILYIAEIKI